MNNSTVTMILYFVVFFGIMYFLLIRPQQKQAKQRQALLSSLRVRDKVITAGGIYGKITKVKEKSVMVQIADKVEIEVTKNGIASVENREITVEKDKKADKNKPVKTKNEDDSNNTSEEETAKEESEAANET
ncbi:preprotein translocase subunit YajC [Desulfitobacterium sp.]|uniref:preprotein translocase subunit YajC n=1 Tax=Desulfitobacterium sp. TaxID=49981 RepID=UPI002B21E810|nr:preprotein translocase subunit YajC [Desulfitobacterium sp.]MEA4900403.1 preprotein translocase subunit YajC [Desulfitobacterium sp.]